MLKIGIVGTGLIAIEHAKAIAMIPGHARLVAAGDKDQGRLREFCSTFGLKDAYADASALIADPEVGLVCVATPPSSHEAIAIAALEAGKHVFCEKPLAHSLASAIRMMEAGRRHPGRMAVGYQLRYEPSFRRLIWLCENEAVGKIRSATVERHSYIPHMDQGAGAWWGKWSVAGGGVLITQLIHELDLLLLVMGPARSVSARMDTRYSGIESEDYVEAEVRFSDGRVARCVVSVNSGRLGGRVELLGANGALGLPWKFAPEDPVGGRKTLARLDAALPATRPQSSSYGARALRAAARRLGVRPKPGLTPHALFYLDIAECMAKGKPLPVPPGEAFCSLELCMAIYESAITDSVIDLPLGPRSAVYDGVTKDSYDARKCSRISTRPQTPGMKTDAIRLGLIGLDTSHATAFAKILHDPHDPFHIPGARIDAAYPGGSPDMEISASRVAGFTAELRGNYGVRILETPEKVADACDLVFILASDGRTHPSLFRAVAGRGKPVFLDKPFAISTPDANEIADVARNTGTKVFASSAFRYADGLVSALNAIKAAGERVKTCRIRAWLPVQQTQGRYFWYGIHAAEMLFACMGTGVSEVQVSAEAGEDRIAVWHADGRESSILGSKTDGRFAVRLETDRRQVDVDLDSSMASLSARILRSALDVLTQGAFPRLWGATHAGSVSGDRPGRGLDPALADTVEIVRFLDAAQRSFATGQKIAV